MSVIELLRRTAEALAGVDLLVVFGSAARGADRPRSDVDVGVRVRLRNDSPAARRAVERVLGRSLRREVDVVYLDEAPPLLRFQIAREGVLIRQAAPHLWSDFRARAMLDWWEWAPTFRMINDAGLRRLRRQAGGGPA
jgi:predicted nucleotidyltransferase